MDTLQLFQRLEQLIKPLTTKKTEDDTEIAITDIKPNSKFIEAVKESFTELSKLYVMLSVCDTDYIEKHYSKFIGTAPFSSLSNNLITARDDLKEKIKIDFNKKIMVLLSELKPGETGVSMESLVTGDLNVQVKILETMGIEVIDEVVDSCIELIIHAMNNEDIISRLIKANKCVDKLDNINFPIDWQIVSKTIKAVLDNQKESDFEKLFNYKIHNLIAYKNVVGSILDKWKSKYNLESKFNIKTTTENIIIQKINDILEKITLGPALREEIRKEFTDFETGKITNRKLLETTDQIIMKYLKEVIDIQKYEKKQILWTYIESLRKIMKYYSDELTILTEKLNPIQTKKPKYSIFSQVVIEDGNLHNIANYVFSCIITQKEYLKRLSELKNRSKEWLVDEYKVLVDRSFDPDIIEMTKNYNTTINMYLEIILALPENNIFVEYVKFPWNIKSHKEFPIYISNDLDKIIDANVIEKREDIDLYVNVNSRFIKLIAIKFIENNESIKKINRENVNKMLNIISNVETLLTTKIKNYNLNNETIFDINKIFATFTQFLKLLIIKEADLQKMVEKGTITKETLHRIADITDSNLTKLMKLSVDIMTLGLLHK